MSKPKAASGGNALHKALTHPLRTEILLAVEGMGRLSPSRFIQQRRAAGDRISLNIAAYHFRVLEGFDVIEVVDEVPRRGATEHWYALNPASPVPDMLSVSQFLQLAMGQEVAKSPIGDGAEALTIMPVEVDEQGHKDLDQASMSMKSRLTEIGTECRRRLRTSPVGSGISLRVGFGALRPPRAMDQGTASSGS